MPEERLVVVNAQELESALDSIIENISIAIKEGVKIEDFYIPSVEIRISDGIPEHSSTITSTMMKSFVGFQGEIHDILKIANGRELTAEEMKASELRVRIEKGSTNIFLNLCQLIAAEVPNMSLEQTIVVMNSVVKAVGIICTAGILTAGVRLFSKERILRIREKGRQQESQSRLEMNKIEAEEKKVELEYRDKQDDRVYHERIAQIQKDKESISTMKETVVSTLDSIEDMIVHSSSAGKYVYRGLAQQAESAQVSIDGTTYLPETLQELGAIQRRPREEKAESVVRVKGNFKTEVISYVDDNVRKINISGTGDDGKFYSFDGLPVVKDALTIELYELINEGSPLHWDIGVTMKGDKWKSVVLFDLKEPQQETLD